ncbi:hypothetical protein [Sphingomonas morindae]|uniref:Adenylate cyclase n=1 Tax=Sphingomonas morindae TaxID=1541170 RepID=A0ABY4XCX3_9SPHN|nr:hypothetical protein [Sphingomonas morindae]USI74767.1 hypothetical protein LHA26_18630 [Sphingomonas morindae]
MATIALENRSTWRGEQRFFVASAIIMTLLVFAGFSFQLAMGRSSFRVPIFLHIHAFFFFGWTLLYLVQTLLAGSDRLALHRRLGWIALVWIPAMLVMGTYVTIVSVRTLHVPFFFQPAYFTVMNPLSLYVSAALAAAAIAMRRRTLWHRRLMFCSMSILLAPAIGRLIPSPLLIPFTGEAVFGLALLFPLAGMIHDARAHGRIHPAWRWGVGAMLAMVVAANAISFSPLGPALYRAVTAGSPGAAQPPLAFPPPPWARPAPRL